ncbi:MAG: pyruvate kinase [Candidatus Jordarchaeaceae archaeon]
MDVFLTLPPYSSYLRDVSRHPIVKGFRFNTGAQLKEGIEAALTRFREAIKPKELWIDLKCRELRITKTTELTKYSNILELNHKIQVQTPTLLYYNEGNNFLQIDRVIDGNKLQIHIPGNLSDNFKVTFGKGAPLNIPHHSLIVEGYLTAQDKIFVEAARKLEIHNYLLSFVEQKADITELLKLDPEAKIIAKIESMRGLEFVEHTYEEVKENVRLMAARGDLYVELERPHQVLNALSKIIKADKDAIAASRILESALNPEKLPHCSDISDFGLLLKMGYRSFLLGDYICEKEEALKSALGLMHAIHQEFLKNQF